MVNGPDFCREMRRGEEPQVDALLRSAFGGEEERRLVAALRREGAIAGEMVLPWQDSIAGYYALSWMVAPRSWLCLAPVAVRPDLQGEGHGRRMVGLLTEWARVSRQIVVVLGQVPFYEAAGFSAARAANLASPFPSEHMLLAGPGDDAPAATLRYPRAFGAG